MKSDEVKAVELVRQIREEQYRELKDKTAEERRVFYRERTRALHEKLGLEPEQGRRSA